MAPPPAINPGRGARQQDRDPDPIEGSMERLHWTAPEGASDDDDPVIVALPQFLPVGPGQTFPHLHPLVSTTSFHETFPLLEVWRRGMAYACERNGNHSVTLGGPLFHLPALELDDNVANPTDVFELVDDLFTLPVQLSPVDGRFREVADVIVPWADHMWVELGGRLEPEAPTVAVPAAADPFTATTFRDAMEPLIGKDRDFRLYPRTMARIRILLGGDPLPPPDGDDLALLPPLKTDFVAYLRMGSGASAADELKELTRTAIRDANSSRISICRDATFDSDAVTLAFSDRLRTFQFLTDRLVTLSKTHAQTNLGIWHFFSPVRAALSLVAEGDAAVKTLVMANASNSASQIDATKNSKLYTGGKIDSFRCLYEAVCNFRVLCTIMVEDPDRCLLLQKLSEYTDILMDISGKSFWEAYCNQPYLPVHAYQDLQHIFSAFITVATNSTLTKSVEGGNPITIGNYATALAVANGHIHNLKAVVNGNGLGSFRDVPHCASWFGTPPGATRAAPNPRTTSERTAPVSGRTSNSRATPADLAQVTERLRALGVLEFDASAPNAKADFFDKVNVRAKKRGSREAERLCVRYLTKGFACSDSQCKRPHVPNLNTLPEPDRRKLIEFVSRTPGLSWVSGQQPAGTA